MPRRRKESITIYETGAIMTDRALFLQPKITTSRQTVRQNAFASAARKSKLLDRMQHRRQTARAPLDRPEMTSHEEIAKKLEHRLQELTGHVAEIDSELRATLSADWEEQATQLEGHDALEGLEKSKLLEIKQIRAALQRIAQGEYGICIRCGEPIDPKRLKALPTALTCIACAGK
jgi:RNA polymerase-binding transcription factor